MKKLKTKILVSILFSCALLFSTSVNAAINFELVKDGHWKIDVDKYGSKVLSSGNFKTPQGITGAFSILKTDEAKKIYPWGSVRGYFYPKKEFDITGKEKVVSLSQIKEIKITYSSTTDYEMSYLQTSPKIEKEGAYHLVKLPNTNSQVMTKTIPLSEFKQPAWSGLNQPLNKNNCAGLNFQPVIPNGGMSKIQIEKIQFM